MTITIIHRGNIVIVVRVIVIEIIKINLNKTIKNFKYMNIRTRNNLTTIRSSRYGRCILTTATVTILRIKTMTLRSID